MEKIQIGKLKIQDPVIKLLCSGFLLFACALAFTPSSGVFRTIPFFVAGGAACSALSLSPRITASLSAVMTLCTYLASGRNVKESVFYSVIACILTLAGVYAFMFCKAVKKTNKSNLKRKYTLLFVGAIVTSLLLSAVLCGNVVSFVFADSKNTSYIKSGYGSDVQKKYTSYEALAGEYRTYVSFSDKDGVYGNSDECYVVKEDDVVFDDVRNHYENGLLYTADARLASVVSKATWGYNITTSDISFEVGEFLDANANIDDYMSRISYVVSLDSIFYEGERDKFSAVCKDICSALSASKFEFEKILVCGGTASKVLFCFEIVADALPGLSDISVSDFDSSVLEEYNITEATILDYWKNK